MKNVLVVTPSEITDAMIRELVESVGGYWVEEPAVAQGVVEDGEAAIYITAGSLEFSGYDDEDLKRLTEVLGSSPRGLVDIHIGHRAGSGRLAKAMAEAAVKRWRGYLDMNGIETAFD